MMIKKSSLLITFIKFSLYQLRFLLWHVLTLLLVRLLRLYRFLHIHLWLSFFGILAIVHWLLWFIYLILLCAWSVFLLWSNALLRESFLLVSHFHLAHPINISWSFSRLIWCSAAFLINVSIIEIISPFRVNQITLQHKLFLLSLTIEIKKGFIPNTLAGCHQHRSDYSYFLRSPIVIINNNW